MESYFERKKKQVRVVKSAVVKAVELHNLATPDFTYDAISILYWFLVENWIIVICACVPTVL